MNVVAPVWGWARAMPTLNFETLMPAAREKPDSMLREYVAMSVLVL